MMTFNNPPSNDTLSQTALHTTLNFYDNHAQSFSEQTVNVDMQALYTLFLANLPNVADSEQCILDLGCGSGRDSIYFAKQAFKVIALDGSQPLIALAKQNIQNKDKLNGHIDWHCLTFSQLVEQNWQGKFTGIWACASLLHVPYLEIPNLLEVLLSMLTDNGSMYASFKYGDSERIKDDRFFCDLNEARWEDIKLKLIKEFSDITWITQDKRVGREDKWLNILITPVFIQS